jgi:hypothetical protein
VSEGRSARAAVALAAACAAAAVVAAAACGSDTSATPGDAGGDAAASAGGTSTGGTSGSAGASGTGTGATGGGGTGATGGSGGSAGTDRWTPPPEADWRAQTWSPCGGIERAQKPELAVPEYPVLPCPGGRAGCEYVPFPRGQRRPFGSVEGRLDDDIWVTADRSLVVAPVFERFTYAAMLIDGTKARPIDAFTQRREDCNLHFAQWVPEQACVVVADAVATSRVAVFPSSGGRADPPSRVFDAPSELTQLCSRELWVSFGGGVIVDFGSASNDGVDLARTVGATSANFNEGDAARGVMAFMLDPRGSPPENETWVWSPGGGAIKVESSPGDRNDISFDGRDVAWLEYVRNADILAPEEYDLYTIPYVAGGTTATKRLVARLPPRPHCGPRRVGGGYYALAAGQCGVASSPTRIHLYRLSDGRHWSVQPFPDPERPDAMTGSVGILHIDEQELIYIGDGLANRTSSIIRQRIDALGPGEAR